ncbi:MAG: CBS domain-containing protein [Pseudomonadota bacterium]
MTVSAILQTKGGSVHTISSSISVMDAVTQLREHKVGALIACDDGSTIAGILSERDIVRAIAQFGASALEKPISELMTRDVVTCTEQTTARQMMEIMTEGRFRHCPVVRDEELVGIVSIGDVVKRRIADMQREADDIKSYITAV